MKIEKSSTNCFCSRGILSLFDSGEHSDELVKLRKHAIYCLPCREKMVETERIYRFFNQQIPLARPSGVLRESYQNEVNDMIKDLLKIQRKNQNGLSFLFRFFSSKKIWFYGGVLMMVLWIASI